MAEDEDVDLEHTALYKCMQEQGLVEREKPDEVRGIRDGAPIWRRILDQFINVSSILLRHLQLQLKVNSACKILVEYFLDEHRKVILNSRALMEDDANFLENLSDFPVQPSSTAIALKCTYLGLSLKTILAPVVLLIAYVCAKLQTRITLSSNASMVAEGVFISALSGYVILQLSVQTIVWRKKKALLQSLSRVTECVRECECFLKSARKCLNYIQELEVIGRGLILTTVGTSVSKMEQSMLFPRLQSLPSGCLCNPLRIYLFSCLRERFRDTKMAALQLIDSYPLRNEIDNGHYVAYMADQEFGTLLATDVTKCDQSFPTDSLSVSAIKAMGQLFAIQLSEFLRRLALCYYPEIIAESKSLQIDNCFTIIPPIIESLCLKVKDNSKVLNDKFTFHQKITRERQNVSQKNDSSTGQSVFSSQRALDTAIKSLTLHLQVSLARIEDFRDVLENTEDICRCTVPTHASEHQLNPEAYNTLNEQLELIKQDLHASTLCWEESSVRLQKLGPSREDCVDFKTPVIATIQNPPDCQSSMPLLEKTDIASEDQIFVAYVDENEDLKDDGDCSWNLELRKKTLEERNISKRMFSELKTVLVPKVEEWQKREARALLASGITEHTERYNDSHLDEIVIPLKQATGDPQPKSNQHVADERSAKTSPIESEIPTFSSFNSSIASMAAARSRLLNPTSCETFDSVGEDYCDSDTSSDT